MNQESRLHRVARHSYTLHPNPMRLSLDWLRDYVKLPETGAEVARLLTEHSFETTVLSAEGGEELLDADVLPNRVSDCLSHVGVARELGAILGRKVSWPVLTLPKLRANKPSFTLRVANATLCPRLLAVQLEGVRGDAESPPWMRRRLQAVGVRPQNLVVDVTNYVLWEIGQPTHAFDARSIGRTLGVRPSRQGERIRTLDGVERTLPDDVLVLTSDDKPIDVAGLMGGQEASVRDDSSAIVLTSALFDRVAVRKASQVLRLRTDASDRYSKGRTAAHVEAGTARVVALLQKLSGARVTARADTVTRKAEQRVVRVRPREVSMLLGLSVPPATQKKILVSLGCRVAGSAREFRVTPPLFRTDLGISQDIAEEVGRVLGLEKIPAVAPRALLQAVAPPDEVLTTRALQDRLRAAGWTETLSYSFSFEEETLALGLDRVEHQKLVNPLNRDQIRLRVSLLPNLLHQACAGAKRVPVLRWYEIGRVYPSAVEKFGNWKAREPLRASGLLVRRGEVPDTQRQRDFYDTKGVVEDLLTSLGLSDVRFDAFEPSPQKSFLYVWRTGQCAEARVGERDEVGVVGAVSSEVLERIGIRGSVIAFDLDLSKLLVLEREVRTYVPPLPYPTVIRDLSILVPDTVLVDTLMEAIDHAGAPLVQDVDFVDFYEGDHLPESRRSVTLRVTYGSPKRTLRDAEVNEAHDKVCAHLEEKFGVEARE